MKEFILSKVVELQPATSPTYGLLPRHFKDFDLRFQIFYEVFHKYTSLSTSQVVKIIVSKT